MKKINVFIIALFPMFLFPGCWSVHNFIFSHENISIYAPPISEPYIYLLNSGENDNYLSIDFNMDTEYQIEDFEYISGLIKIGNQEILLDKNIISINIEANRKWNSVYWVIYGKWFGSKLNEPILERNENQMIHYMFSVSKSKITNKEINNIIKEYKKNNIVNLELNFKIKLNNEIFLYEIKEDYTIEIETQKWNIFKAALLWIILGGGKL
jgi:hypothetical protein